MTKNYTFVNQETKVDYSFFSDLLFTLPTQQDMCAPCDLRNKPQNLKNYFLYTPSPHLKRTNQLIACVIYSPHPFNKKEQLDVRFSFVCPVLDIECRLRTPNSPAALSTGRHIGQDGVRAYLAKVKII